MLKVSTFCSGIGSPEVALKNLGIEHEIILTAEIDKYARETYLANHSTKKMINDMTVPDYEGEEYYADINISGLPCQAFSLAGKRLGELDPRGLLFFDFYRYVKNQNPKYFIIENVKGLLSDNDGNTFQNWINLLGQSVNGDPFMFPHEDSLMYNLHWQVLNTKDYGLPQNRERVFLIGIRNDLPNSFVFPKGVPLKLRLKDVLEDEVDEKYYLSDKFIQGGEWRVASADLMIGAMRGRNPENPSDRTTGAPTQQMLEINENGTSNCLTSVQKDNLVIQLNPSLESGGVQPYQQNRVYDGNGIAPALCRGKSDLNVTENDYRIRKLTVLECLRLQGFPDEFLQNAIDAGVSNSQLYKQSGNSISVPVIQAILKNLLIK